MAEGWELAGTVRTDFADMMDGLSAEQLDAPSLCDGWTNRDVLGHLAGFVEIGLPKFFFNIAKTGFNYDKASTQMAKAMAERPTSELLAALRTKATKPSAMPMFPAEMTIADVCVHTQDVRRPLGLDGALDEDALRVSLVFFATHKMAKNVSGREMPAVTVTATDLDWTHGSGPALEGTGEALLMALAGRPTIDELTGDGVELLA